MQKMISSKKRTLGVLRSTQSWDCLLKTACLAAGIPVCSWILLGYATLEGVNSPHWTLDDFFALKGESSPQEALLQLFDFTIQPDKLAFSQLYPVCNWWNRCFSTTQQGGAHQREIKTAPRKPSKRGFRFYPPAGPSPIPTLGKCAWCWVFHIFHGDGQLGEGLKVVLVLELKFRYVEWNTMKFQWLLRQILMFTAWITMFKTWIPIFTGWRLTLAPTLG